MHEEPSAPAGGSSNCGDDSGREQRRLGIREGDQGLELVAARFAFPQMPHAVPVEILGPLRQEDRLPALGAEIHRPGMFILPGARGSELHDASSAMFLSPLRMAAMVTHTAGPSEAAALT